MSKLKLRSSEYVPFALKSAGAVRVNHESVSCNGSSKSLLITTKTDGGIVATCFRCGGSGFAGTSGFVRTGRRDKTAPARPYSVEIPAACVEWDEFPLVAKKWLMKAKMTKALCGQHGIVWSKKFETLVIPANNGEKLSAVVHRGFGDDNRYRLLTDDGNNSFILVNPKECKTIVLVEDSLSAYRVSDAMQEDVGAIALLGINLRSGVKNWLLKNKISKLVVWLDNDTSKVKLNARQIAKELSWIDVRVVSAKADAKYYNNDEIIGEIWKALS